MAEPVRPRPAYHIGGQRIEAGPLSAGLYLVATPIGNLADITLRALETLAACDMLYCEDTRTTRVLLDRYGLKPMLRAYHEHNGEHERPRILAELAAGRAVALCSDAGTPLISDPGFKLVAAAAAAGHAVIPLPGPSALLAALTGSGLATDSFHFAGFLPAKAEARRQKIESLSRLGATLILYESPHRLDETLAELAAVMGGDRTAVVARELTKTFEEFRRATLGELAAHYAREKPRGEIVIVIGASEEVAASDGEIDRLLAAALLRLPASKAAAEVARLTGVDRKAMYERALTLKDAAP